MTMRRVSSAVAGAVIAASIGVAHAAPAQHGPQVTDPCGDAPTQVSAFGHDLRLEQADGARDVRTGQFRLLHTGTAVRAIEARVEVCGGASTAAQYLVAWGFADNCGMHVEYVPRRVHEGVLAPEVRLSEVCYEDRDEPVVKEYAGNEVRQVSQVVLPASAAVFDGPTVTLTVPFSDVPAASLPRFADGTEWTSSAAIAADGEIWGYAMTGGSFQNPDAHANLRFDYGVGRGYRVGQDAPR